MRMNTMTINEWNAAFRHLERSARYGEYINTVRRDGGFAIFLYFDDIWRDAEPLTVVQTVDEAYHFIVDYMSEWIDIGYKAIF